MSTDVHVVHPSMAEIHYSDLAGTWFHRNAFSLWISFECWGHWIRPKEMFLFLQVVDILLDLETCVRVQSQKFLCCILL